MSEDGTYKFELVRRTDRERADYLEARLADRLGQIATLESRLKALEAKYNDLDSQYSTACDEYRKARAERFKRFSAWERDTIERALRLLGECEGDERFLKFTESLLDELDLLVEKQNCCDELVKKDNS